MGRHHLRNYAALDEAELVALVDINPDTKAMADDHGVRHYIDYEKMLDEQQPDAVSIVVPTPFHAEIASATMKRGIHCMLEKPITSTVDEADRLIKLAKKHGIVFTVGHI